MKPRFLLLPLLAGSLLLSGCIIEDRYGYYDDRPAYHGSRSVDFYYTSGRPYSRSYGPLVMRDNRYYYSRGGGYVVYDRPTYAYRGSSYGRRSRVYREPVYRTQSSRVVRHGVGRRDARPMVVTERRRPGTVYRTYR